jgi:ubiquinone/menaquinone biosynthesis C-methylase UbiE
MGRVHGMFVHERRARVLATRLAGLIPSHQSVLDVGCGDGLIDALLMAGRPDLSIDGVDLFVRPNARIPVMVFDGHRLPYLDRSRDIVLFCDVLHHADRPEALLREGRRVARSRVLVKDHFAATSFDRAVLRVMDRAGNAPHGVATPYHYFSPSEWVRVWRESRLGVHEIQRELHMYPWWLDVLFGRSLHFIASLDCDHGS